MLLSHFVLGLSLVTFIAAECTKTHTVYTTVTGGTTTLSTTRPAITVTHYSSTVLIGTPYHGPKPFPYYYSISSNPYTCDYYTGTDIPPAPSASGSVLPREADPARCTTVQTTVKVEYLCVYTATIDPPPIPTHGKGVLTTRVPDFCTVPRKKSTGQVPDGNEIYPLIYPYFAFTAVECCIYCSEQYYNLVASGFIKSGLDCQCLVNHGSTYPGVSHSCPRGIEPYALGKEKGHAFLGPCGTPP